MNESTSESTSESMSEPVSERKPSRACWEDCLCQGLLTTEVVAYLEMLAQEEQEKAAQKPYEHPSGEKSKKREGGKV